MVTEKTAKAPIPQSTPRTTLFAGDRSRPGIETVSQAAYDIQRRDLKITFRIFPKQCRYQQIPIVELLTPEELANFQKAGQHWNSRYGASKASPPSQNFRITIEHLKTSERADMFDCIARRWRVINREERIQGDTKSSTETITDAWYLDPVITANRYAGFSPATIQSGFCYAMVNGERPVIDFCGDAPPEGLCAQSESITTSSFQLPNGERREERNVRSFRILSLSEERFDPRLFEPPAGYKQMLVYPSRFTMGLADLRRNVNVMWYRLRMGIAH